MPTSSSSNSLRLISCRKSVPESNRSFKIAGREFRACPSPPDKMKLLANLNPTTTIAQAVYVFWRAENPRGFRVPMELLVLEARPLSSWMTYCQLICGMLFGFWVHGNTILTRTKSMSITSAQLRTLQRRLKTWRTQRALQLVFAATADRQAHVEANATL